IPQFPGVSSTYDVPGNADVVCDTSEVSIEECVEQILAVLDERGFLGGEPQ
ncbi:MAG: adenylyl-sulfate kinase, partial [Actinobacteria bacterium ATB1]|nr:adenylyl-sulfate kinase [Actinobacteria bacterium ATB1]